ncbi:hypothetical protein PGT21_015088 [Puccinia graminis f. sp. tritici]|uniref:Uncharacterized protein n=1 Tax=Puccinia graminis f. sp. tritici TaxID=56615 RepID=A0A5B0M2N4_PUCGR|nr:hypothetical protein PGT21_015088 [Puccinia graminis f. sp. tritici]KAA1089879.1 hypothetical protein PGTUg99_025814 [Puccinia graminis f. sp. tritici]
MQKTQAFVWILLISILLEANTIRAANQLMRQWRLRGDASGRVTSLPIIPNQDDRIIFSSDLETKEWKVENSSSEHSLLCKIRKSGTINWRVVQIIPPNSEIRTGIGMKKSIWVEYSIYHPRPQRNNALNSQERLSGDLVSLRRNKKKLSDHDVSTQLASNNQSLRKMVLSFFMMLLVITPHALR